MEEAADGKTIRPTTRKLHRFPADVPRASSVAPSARLSNKVIREAADGVAISDTYDQASVTTLGPLTEV